MILNKIIKHKDKVKKVDRKGKILVNFYLEKEMWNKFKDKYDNASSKLRNLVESALQKNHISGTETMPRDDTHGLLQIVNDVPALQIIGDIGVGKSTMVKNLIKQDRKHVYVVIDAHNEYDLPEVKSITNDITESSVVKLPEMVSGGKGVFSVYHNQILSQKLPDNFIVVVDEAHRYKEIKEMLKESRKFVKVITITPEPLGFFCKVLKVTV